MEDILKQFGFIWERYADESLQNTDTPEPDDLVVYLHPAGYRAFVSQDEGQWVILNRDSERIGSGHWNNNSLEVFLGVLLK